MYIYVYVYVCIYICMYAYRMIQNVHTSFEICETFKRVNFLGQACGTCRPGISHQGPSGAPKSQVTKMANITSLAMFNWHLCGYDLYVYLLRSQKLRI